MAQPRWSQYAGGLMRSPTELKGWRNEANDLGGTRCTREPSEAGRTTVPGGAEGGAKLDLTDR